MFLFSRSVLTTRSSSLAARTCSAARQKRKLSSNEYEQDKGLSNETKKILAGGAVVGLLTVLYVREDRKMLERKKAYDKIHPNEETPNEKSPLIKPK